jgi:uncharacterized protein (DUF1697 family)
VNLGGHNMVRMSDLKELCTSLGFDEVQTLLASGNVAFSAKRKPSEATIAEAIRATCGPSVRVMLRSGPELRSVVERNPFHPIRNPSHLIVFFLEREPAGQIAYAGPEIFHVDGCELYVDYANGQGRSKLTSNLIERSLGVAGTGRNWNTINKLLALERV